MARSLFDISLATVCQQPALFEDLASLSCECKQKMLEFFTSHDMVRPIKEGIQAQNTCVVKSVLRKVRVDTCVATGCLQVAHVLLRYFCIKSVLWILSQLQYFYATSAFFAFVTITVFWHHVSIFTFVAFAL